MSCLYWRCHHFFIEAAGIRVSLEIFWNRGRIFRNYSFTNCIKTCPRKEQDIINYNAPKILRGLRSFLGLAGYYRRFVRDYDAIVKPFTKYLQGENWYVTASKSKGITITLDSDAKNAFEIIKMFLISEDVLLQYLDFQHSLELTTNALGAVLPQNNRPIYMISRTLSVTESNYAPNQREWFVGT